MKLFTIFLVIIVLTNLSSASFVCGVVNGTQKHSSSWLKVISYYEENTSATTSCSVNPEGKYCCDLEEIHEVGFKPGKKVYAEVLDEKTGYVAGPVKLITTDEGYTVFEKMKLENALSVEFNHSKILINNSEIKLNITSHTRFPNLKYKLKNNNQTIEKEICNNCTKKELNLNLQKGKSELEIIAYGKREISKKIIFYSLNFLEIKREIECNGCVKKSRGYIVTPKANVKMKLILNSSHQIKGKLTDYFPINWISNSSLVESFSKTHDKIIFDISEKDTSINYTLKAPDLFFPRIYEFETEFEGHKISDYVRLSKFKFWPWFLYIKNEMKRFIAYQTKQTTQSISPKNPLVLQPENPEIEILAIYPTEQKLNTYAILESRRNLFWQKDLTNFRILTNLRDKEIKNILIGFKIPKEKTPEAYQGFKILNLKLLKSEENFNYYELILKKNDPFSLRLF